MRVLLPSSALLGGPTMVSGFVTGSPDGRA
jgi:hypothetical protein